MILVLIGGMIGFIFGGPVGMFIGFGTVLALILVCD